MFNCIFLSPEGKVYLLTEHYKVASMTNQSRQEQEHDRTVLFLFPFSAVICGRGRYFTFTNPIFFLDAEFYHIANDQASWSAGLFKVLLV